ncbi:DUF488 domain-containing protein [Tessaracoccus caeni]|uniref:DUF488 domain-containing protein n=1 Tax=Tessaracoccus caeni TaxID=3031239 RepID=UPI0023DAA4AE|nr:DUF488 domain-containing protein [Tessaracoccus caeni]MDF1489952.1 DUF488 domain-containing protein [Tessaracoccus caeni]
MHIQIKRIYEEPDADDGFRVLVDRLWPRGVSKEKAALDLWDKDVAPSPDLRTWWNHDPDRFDEFAQRYRAELEASDAPAALLHQAAGHNRLTLLYAAHDPAVNHALVLQDYLAHHAP